MSLPAYKRHYAEDDRLNEVYRLYVDGKGSIREIESLTGVSRRRIERHCSKDNWTEEKAARGRAVAAAAVVAAVASVSVADAASTPEEIEAQLTAALNSDDVKSRIGAVMAQERQFWDQVAEDLNTAYRARRKKAKDAGRDVTAGDLFPFVALGGKVREHRFKAHGIPDVTKLEMTGANGGPMEFRQLTDDQLDAELEAAERAAAEAAARTAAEGRVN